MAISLLIGGCNNTTNSEVYVKKEAQITKSVEPNSFKKYALVASGNLNVKGKLTTDGPLGDVYIAKEIKARALSLDISGKIKASNNISGSIIRSFDYEDANMEEFVKIRALKVSEYLNTTILDDYYLLTKDGKAIHKIKEQEDMSLPNNILTNFDNSSWHISGNNIEIDRPLVVEGDLNITTSSIFIKGTLMVEGNLYSKGELNINQGTPFDKSLIVDKNIEVDSLISIGRIHGSGNFISHSTVNILGNAEIDGDVTLYGDAKINLLDNVYKAALFDAQNESKDKNISLTLVHSQLFSDVNNKNSVILFTFVEGNYIMNEKTILNLIEQNATQKFKFKSYLYGASIDYGSQLERFDGLSNYFINKQNVIRELEAKGYSDLKVSEHIDIAPSNLYLTFESNSGTTIGTYLVYSLSRPYIDELIEFTPIHREEALYNLTHKDEIEKDNELNSQLKMEEQKDNIINNQELNLTVKSEMLNEIESAEANISNIDKEALKAEATTNRVQEWVQYKDLATDTKVVLAEKITDINSTQTRGFWSFIKKIFRVVTFNYCYKHTQTKRIKGVDSDSTHTSNDLWARNVSLNNSPYDYCTPTSVAMIVQYHKISKGRGKFYSLNKSDKERSKSGDSNNAVKLLAGAFGTSKNGGTAPWSMFWRVPFFTTLTLSANQTPGYAWTWYTTFWNRSWQHYIIKSYINNNQPLVYSISSNFFGNEYIGGDEIKNHTMPVIGYKREYYTGWCWKSIMPERKWVLVDTTYLTRGYLRFDSISNYWTVGSMMYIWSF